MKKGYQFTARYDCPYCERVVPFNWYVRHIREQHPEHCDPIWGNCTHCDREMNDIDRPPYTMELPTLEKRYKLCDDCYTTALRRMSVFWDWLWAEEPEEETEEETNVAR